MAKQIFSIDYLARLARLELNKQHKTDFQRQLKEILDYVGQLNNLQLDKVKIVHQINGLKNIVREDKVQPSLSLEQARQNATAVWGDYFKVARVLKKED